MSSNTEDFPTPVSPTTRMVSGALGLLFRDLMIPCLRDSTSLGNMVRTTTPKVSL